MSTFDVPTAYGEVDPKLPHVFVLTKDAKGKVLRLFVNADGKLCLHPKGKPAASVKDGGIAARFAKNADARHLWITGERHLAEGLRLTDLEKLMAMQAPQEQAALVFPLAEGQPGALKAIESEALPFAGGRLRDQQLEACGGASAARVAELEAAAKKVTAKPVTVVEDPDWSAGPVLLTSEGKVVVLSGATATPAIGGLDPAQHKENVHRIRLALDAVPRGPLSGDEEKAWKSLQEFLKRRISDDAKRQKIEDEAKQILDEGPYRGTARVGAPIVYGVIAEAALNKRFSPATDRAQLFEDKLLPTLRDGTMGIIIEKLGGSASAAYERTYNYIAVSPDSLNLEDNAEGIWGRSLIIHEATHGVHDIMKERYGRSATEVRAHGTAMDYVLHEIGAVIEQAKGAKLNAEAVRVAMDPTDDLGFKIYQSDPDTFCLQKEFLEHAARNYREGVPGQNGYKLASCRDIAEAASVFAKSVAERFGYAPRLPVFRDSSGNYFRKLYKHDLKWADCDWSQGRDGHDPGFRCKEAEEPYYFEDYYPYIVTKAPQFDTQANAKTKELYAAWKKKFPGGVPDEHEYVMQARCLKEQFDEEYERDGLGPRRTDVGEILEEDWHANSDPKKVQNLLKSQRVDNLFDQLHWGQSPKDDKVADCIADALKRASRARFPEPEVLLARGVFNFASGHPTHAFDLVEVKKRAEAWAGKLPESVKKRLADGGRAVLRSHLGKGEERDVAQARLDTVKAALASALGAAPVTAEVVDKPFVLPEPPAPAAGPAQIVETLADPVDALRAKAHELSPWTQHSVVVELYAKETDFQPMLFARVSIAAWYVPQSKTRVMVLATAADGLNL